MYFFVTYQEKAGKTGKVLTINDVISGSLVEWTIMRRRQVVRDGSSFTLLWATEVSEFEFDMWRRYG